MLVKSMGNQIEDALPEWRDKFLSYKELKKRLKLIEVRKPSSDLEEPMAKKQQLIEGESVDKKEGMKEAEVDFMNLLENEVDKFNFFVEKEQEYIIKLKDLQDKVSKAKDWSDEILRIRKQMVDLHCEMVLLEKYSSLNHTGLVKILKKYHKRTGAVLRLPFIQKVLQQPFFTTDSLYKLVKECEALLDNLFPMNESPSTIESGNGNELSTSSTTINEVLLKCPKELAEIEYTKSLYTKMRTISALRVLKEIHCGSSTVSLFSLEPAAK